jgi:hypothetical protein
MVTTATLSHPTEAVSILYFTAAILIAINNCGPNRGRSKEITMVESHPQPASVGSESEIETGLATQSITILGLRFDVRWPYGAGHVCTEGEATALNQKRLQIIRSDLAVIAKDRALTHADVDAYAASYVFGGRTARRRTIDPVKAEALELARRLVRKKEQTRKENTQAARELLQSENGDAIRAQAARRIAELKDLMVASPVS